MVNGLEFREQISPNAAAPLTQRPFIASELQSFLQRGGEKYIIGKVSRVNSPESVPL
jgi:hypothetical protein